MLAKIAAKLLAAREQQENELFLSVDNISDALRGILDSDLVDPMLVGVEVVEPKEHEGDFVLVKDKLIWIIKASDETLYSLKVAHSLDANFILYALYANEGNPYGSDEAKLELENLGINVTYDKATQTWTIDFGENITRDLLAEGTITFHIELTDEQGYSWGSITSPTADNTFTYELEDYYEYAFEQIMAATNQDDFVSEIIKYADASTIEEEVIEIYNNFTVEEQDDVNYVLFALKTSGYLHNLGDIKNAFETYVRLKETL